jgi:MFS family permease
MFDNRTRGMAITLFSMTVFTGPLLAPFIGGFIVMSHLGWRWTEYLTAIMGFLAFALNLLFLSESYPPEILVSKAAELRRRTKNWGIHAKQEEIEVDFRELLEKNFSRPIRMLISERIVLLLSVYMAFIYGLLYLFLTAYPLVFQGVHHMNLGVGGLPFFGMITGQLLAGVTIFVRQPAYQRKLAANNNIPIPEWRLPEVILGGICFAVGIFWFGWTGYKQDIHWIGKISHRTIELSQYSQLTFSVPTLSGLLIGFGLLSIFLQALNYLVDAYLMVSIQLHTPGISSNSPSSSPPLRLQQTRSCVVCVARLSRYSRGKCLRVWVYSGLLHCLGALLSCWYQYRFGSTSGARRLERSLRLHRHFLSRPLHRKRWLRRRSNCGVLKVDRVCDALFDREV